VIAPSHQGLYRNSPLVIGGLLAAIALSVAGVAAAMLGATTGDELLPLVLAALGAFVSTSLVCMLPPGQAPGEGLIRKPDQAGLPRSPAACRRQ
jgi:hypothetical protein